MHCRVAHLGSMDGGHGGQLRLRPTALVGRCRALVRQQLGTQPYLAPGQIRERRLEADQRSDGQRVRVQHNGSVAAATILAGSLGVASGPAEQRTQRHVLAERHQPRLGIRAAHTVGSDEHRRLVDSATGRPCIDVDQQVRSDAPSKFDKTIHGRGVAGEIDADAALAPDHEVDPLTGQRFSERLTCGLTRRGLHDVTGLDERDPDRRPRRGCRPPPEPHGAEHREHNR